MQREKRSRACKLYDAYRIIALYRELFDVCRFASTPPISIGGVYISIAYFTTSLQKHREVKRSRSTKTPPLSGTFERRGSNRFKPDQTGKKNPKKCTVSSSDRLYKPSRYYNCDHNCSPISAQHFDSTPQPRSNTSRCRDGSGTPSFASIYLYIYI